MINAPSHPFKETPCLKDAPLVVTFGCRLNSYESQVIKDLAKEAGLENTIIINTCAVTSEAERQARQTIRRLRKAHPEAQIIVTGCSSQIDPERYAGMAEVSRVIGNEEKMQVSSYSKHHNHDRILVSDIMSVQETAGHLVSGFEERARAFVQVQNGCDHRCTYCSIPYGRGNSRSVAIGEIVSQVRSLIASGYQEIVMTGVDITAYGADLPGTPTLGQMIRRLLGLVPQLKRLRLSSLDPVEIDEDLWRLIGEEERLLPHLHLSVQAGDDMILKRMKRRHSRRDTLVFCEKARNLRPGIVFGADLIAGFPTETDSMFENTFKSIEECGLTYLHVFPYSSRPGTPASRMPQVPGPIIKERARRLRQEGEKMLFRFYHSCLHKEACFLVESIEPLPAQKGEEEKKIIKGKTDHFASVYLTPFTKDAQNLAIGSAYATRIIEVTSEGLKGEIII